MSQPSAQPPFISQQVTRARYRFPDMDPKQGDGLAIVCAGVEQCEPTYAINRRDFPYHSIEYVQQGGGSLVLAGQVHHLSSGWVFSYGPGLAHRITSDPSAPMTKYFVDFTGLRSEELLRESGLGVGRAVGLSGANRVRDIFEGLLETSAGESPASARLMVKWLEVLALTIGELAGPREHDGSHHGRAVQSYRAARSYIEQRYLKLNTLEQIAAGCAMDGAYLCRLFARFDTQSPYQFLIRLKMNHAATLLLRSGRLVKEVAAEVGYRDPYHFSRVFKRVHGIPPEQVAKGAGPQESAAETS